MPALSPSSENSSSASKKISFRNEPNVINVDVELLDLHDVVQVEPLSHVEKPNSQLSVRINSSLVNANYYLFFFSISFLINSNLRTTKHRDRTTIRHKTL
jgi:hypothetical protein